MLSAMHVKTSSVQRLNICSKIEYIRNEQHQTRLLKIVRTMTKVDVPATVMSNEHVPSFIEVSLALHVTVVVPREKESPDDTILPEMSVHVVTEIGPSTISSANGISDQVTGVLPSNGFTNTDGKSAEQVTSGASLSA